MTFADSNGAATSTVTLTSPQTVGRITFANTMDGSYTIAGSTLTLNDSGDPTGANPSITVLAGSHSITAPMNLVNGISLNVVPGCRINLEPERSPGRANIAATGGGKVNIGPGILPSTTNLAISTAATVALPPRPSAAKPSPP